jgi:hypothetical protein
MSAAGKQKIGLQAHDQIGRIGYLQHAHEDACLVVVNFQMSASKEYLCRGRTRQPAPFSFAVSRASMADLPNWNIIPRHVHRAAATYFRYGLTQERARQLSKPQCICSARYPNREKRDLYVFRVHMRPQFPFN